ncbi:MAG TPA: hypothetical protein VMR21_14780 [Vicinamibacteria bacterium]|nr:hypothetical protein [Vicinamibacteria bacterium]
MPDLSPTLAPALADDAPDVLSLLRRCALPTEGVAEGLARGCPASSAFMRRKV